MIILSVNLWRFLDQLETIILLVRKQMISLCKGKRQSYHILSQIEIMGIGSLAIVLLTAFFIGMVFTFQVAKEFSYLNATDLVGSVLTMTFVRELSPVLTAVIVTGRIGSAFTAEIATMKVTEQIDVLYVLQAHPLNYLVVPRILACLVMLPLLNIFALATSISSSILVSSILYHIPPSIFLDSSSISILDFVYSSCKAVVFGLIISIVSCTWGLKTKGGARSVGQSTTSSVVTSLLLIFIVDFLLSYCMFHTSGSVFQA
jgi:phospholipid/cholesterol/gamma-HCH transport system permease protein